MRKRVFSTNGNETTSYLYGENINLDPYLKQYTKFKRWITDLNVEAKTIKLLEENIEQLSDFGVEKLQLGQRKH